MSKNILICDDAAFMRNVLKFIFTHAGFNVVGEAATGYEAVNLYKKLQPDLITMDITMPELDGISAAGEIVKYDRKAVIIMISAMGQEQLVTKAIKNGATDFLVKPFEDQALVSVVSKYLEGK